MLDHSHANSKIAPPMSVIVEPDRPQQGSNGRHDDIWAAGLDTGPTRFSEGQTFVITGANAGTGFQAARILLGKGAKVVMLNRSADKSAAAIAELQHELGPDAEVFFVRTDLASLDSVRTAAAEVLAAVPRIDALICNAAIAQVPTQRLTVDGHESMLGTNHNGHFLLSGLLFERIEESKGRIVVSASLGYKMGIRTIQFDDMNWDANYHQNKTYSQSKLAQMMFAYELQDRLAERLWELSEAETSFGWSL